MLVTLFLYDAGRSNQLQIPYQIKNDTLYYAYLLFSLFPKLDCINFT